MLRSASSANAAAWRLSARKYPWLKRLPGAFMNAVFRSKTFRQPQPTSFACAEVVASAYPVRLTVLADGVQRFTTEVQSREPVRLPAGFRAMDWVIEAQCTGAAAVQAVILATSIQELAAV